MIPADREITALPEGGYRVTAAWLLERYALERSLRRELETCETTLEDRHPIAADRPPGGHP